MLLLNLYTNILIHLIINRYHFDCGCLIIFTDDNHDDFSYTGNIPSIKIKIINGTADYKLIFHNFGCQSIIIYSDNPIGIVVEVENQIRLGMERFNRRKFLIAPRNPSDNFETDFFNLKQLDFISDLLLLLPKSPEQNFELKTHKYVGLDSNQPVLLDQWFLKNQSFLYGRDLYPDKITNQHGRPLRMATFTYEPYSVVGSTVEEHYGSELVSAVTFAQKHNMTPVPVVNEEDYWGEIFANWSGNGLLGNLVKDKADIGFSALYTWEVCYHYLDLSKPLVRTGITCLVPAPKLAARWLTPLLSYSPELWVWVVINLVVGIVILSLILFSYSDTNTQSNYFGCVEAAFQIVTKPVLQQSLPSTQIPDEVASKFMMGLMLVLSLFLTSTYSSGLASIMTLPRYENAINTVAEFASSGLDWGATQDAWITSIQSAEEPTYVTIVSKFHPTPEEDLQKFSETGRFAFSIERLPSENFAVGGYIKEDVIGNFHLMQQDLYWEQCVIMLRKNSVLLPSLDLFVLRVFEAGLVSKWQNKAVNMFMDPYVQRAVRYYTHHSQEAEVVKLEWSHVEGAFAILAIGYCASFAAFIAEIIIYRNKKKGPAWID